MYVHDPPNMYGIYSIVSSFKTEKNYVVSMYIYIYQTCMHTNITVSGEIIMRQNNPGTRSLLESASYLTTDNSL